MSCKRLPLVLLIFFLFPAAFAPADVSDEQVGKAIDKIKEYLYYNQDAQTGSWEFGSGQEGGGPEGVQVGGQTALVTLSLIISDSVPKGEPGLTVRFDESCPPPREINPAVPLALSNLAMLCIQPDAKQRPKSMDQVCSRLDIAARQLPK